MIELLENHRDINKKLPKILKSVPTKLIFTAVDNIVRLYIISHSCTFSYNAKYVSIDARSVSCLQKRPNSNTHFLMPEFR